MTGPAIIHQSTMYSEDGSVAWQVVDKRLYDQAIAERDEALARANRIDIETAAQITERRSRVDNAAELRNVRDERDHFRRIATEVEHLNDWLAGELGIVEDGATLIDRVRQYGEEMVAHQEAMAAAHLEMRIQETLPSAADRVRNERDAARAIICRLHEIRGSNGCRISAHHLRYAATHEALCRTWIYDVLTQLADIIDHGGDL